MKKAIESKSSSVFSDALFSKHLVPSTPGCLESPHLQLLPPPLILMRLLKTQSFKIQLDLWASTTY